jgi:2-C-methyl-D-erythritol 4-phosphate cytidylyltransferase/2-C-methyl-D-erythritol 2,4-cyclodiphosphate synthase
MGSPPHTTAVILAAGASRRAGPGPLKPFRLLAGEPVLAHSLRTVARVTGVRHVLVVLPEAYVAAAGIDLARLVDGRPLTVVPGGARRADSVRAALGALPRGTDLVALHDAARPLATADLWERVLAAATRTGAATAGLPVHDALRWRAAPPGGALYLDRTAVLTVQTPQAFRTDLLRAAHAAAGADDAPDDAALVSALGHPVEVVPGEAANLKLTGAEDLDLADRWIDPRPAAADVDRLRVGLGTDVHRLVAGRPLRLGGVEIPYPRGPSGHSDADAVAHAVADAILGASGLGDLGDHFPPGDPACAGLPGAALLARVAGLAAASGHVITQVDVSVTLEAPRLRPHREAMRAALGAALGLDPRRVSVKATTAEGLGSVGRGASVLAQAVVLVRAPG